MLRSFKTRTLVVFTLVLLSAVFSASALTANLNGPFGYQAGSIAASVFSVFSSDDKTAPVASAIPAESRELNSAKGTRSLKRDDDPMAPAVTFTNPAPIAIPDSGTATPYPSTISVSGIAGSVQTVAVTINSFSHTFPEDVGMVLVGPGGQAFLLQASAGGGNPMTAVTYALSDAGATDLPDAAAWAPGTYDPTAYSLPTFTGPGPGTMYVNPGPVSGGTGALNSTFLGTNPNGVWSLYVQDFAAQDLGSIAGGWNLDIIAGACAPPPGDMVAWFPGQNNASDIIGNPPNNGSHTGTFAPGQVGNGFQYDGATQDTNVPNSAALNPNSISLDAWVNPIDDPDAFGGVITKFEDADPNRSYGIYLQDSGAGTMTIAAYVNQAGATPEFSATGGTITVSSATFDHIAMTFDATTAVLNVYLNGVQVGTATGVPGVGVQPGTNPVVIGDDDQVGANGFAGVIDEAEIFSRALSGAEINQIFIAGANGKCHVSTIQFDAPTGTVGESAGSYTFNVNRTGANDTSASVLIELAPGTATEGTACGAPAGADYVDVAPGTRVNFAPGERTQQVTVTICGDGIDEPDETFTATLSDPTGTGASVGIPSNQTVTITDDDAAATFTVNSPTAIEGSPLGFIITRTGATSFDSTVCYSTTDGTATAGSDYTAIPVTCTTFTAGGPNTFNVNVSTLNDPTPEGPETMQLVLSGITNGTGNGNFGTGTITDNDSTFRIVANAPGNGVEGTPGSFTVFRDSVAPTTTTAQVDVSTLDGSAVGGSAAQCTAGTVDYQASGATLIFAPGVASLPFNVPTCNDNVDEPAETFQAQLSNAIGATEDPDPADRIATWTINDDPADTGQTVTASAAASQSEATSPYVVTLTLSGQASQQTRSITYATSSGTATGGASCATAGVDFVSVPATVKTWLPGDNAPFTVNVTICNDSVFEGNENFNFTLSAPVNLAIGGTNPLVLTITDNEVPPTVTINDVAQNEGNTGSDAFDFTVTLSGATQNPVSITYHTVAGPPPFLATGGVGCPPVGAVGVDYTEVITDTLVIPAGQTSGTIPVIVCGDVTFEQSETFQVILDTTTVGSISDNTGQGTIINDDLPPTVGFDVALGDDTDSEGNTLVHTVTLSAAAGVPVTVNYVTAPGTATSGAACDVGSTGTNPVDFIGESGLVTFAPGETTKTIDIVTCNDTTFEGNSETYTVTLSNPQNSTLGDSSATGTITDVGETAPSFSIGDATCAEGAGCTFNVTRDALAAGTTGVQNGTTLNVTSSSGTATETVDFTTVDGTTVTIPAAGTAGQVTVSTINDTLLESTENFTVNITIASGPGTINDGSGAGTITDNDAVTFAITPPPPTAEGNATGGATTPFVFTVTQTGNTTGTPTIVSYQTNDGTATGGSACGIGGVDYIAHPPFSQVVLPGGTNSTATITVFVCQDITLEPDETFSVTITGVSQGTAPTGAAASATATIVNDDGLPISISGTITNFPGGTPRAGVTVNLSGASTATTTTNASGQYTFTGLASGGNYQVTPTEAGSTFSPLSRTFTFLTASVTNADFVRFANGAVTRNLHIVNGGAAAGQTTNPNVGVNLFEPIANQSASVSGTITYNTAHVTTPVITCGTATPACDLVNGFNTTVPGQITFSIDAPAGTTFPVGENNLFNIQFTATAAASGVANSPVAFTNAPTPLAISDPNANPLPFTTTDGFVVFANGLEGDVAPYPNGDNDLTAADVIVERQIVANLAAPAPNTNVRQRADTAPYITKGDGLILATDLIQVRRYVANLDPDQSAGGPFATIAPPAIEDMLTRAAGKSDAIRRQAAVGRVIRVLSRTCIAGQPCPVTIQIDSLGNEAATGFSLTFNNAVLNASTNVAVGPGAPAGMAVTVNPNELAQGRLGILVDAANPFSTSPPPRDFAIVTFNPPAGTTPGLYTVGFTQSPIPFSTSDPQGNPITDVTYEDGGITILGPTAADVTISGRVTTPEGQGLRNATVFLTNPETGETVTVQTSAFGFYTFEGVESGHSYVVGVRARRYRFTPRTVDLTDSISNFDFEAAN